jgi:hypothetical protein
MKITRVYLDTSTIGGCFDPEFATWSNGLFEDFAAGRCLPVVSVVLETELIKAPPWVRKKLNEVRRMQHEFVRVSDEALDLWAAYVSHGILSLKHKNDMMHVALATVSGCEVLASWNFKHIVRFDKIRRFNAVNLELGYRQVAIHSPRELTGYGRNED